MMMAVDEEENKSTCSDKKEYMIGDVQESCLLGFVLLNPDYRIPTTSPCHG